MIGGPRGNFPARGGVKKDGESRHGDVLGGRELARFRR